MKKLLLFALAVCLIAGSSLAQISFGPKIGMNISTFTQHFKDSDDEMDLTFKFGQSIGGIVNIQINNFLAFQPSLSVINKGASYDLDKMAEEEAGLSE
ncbi:MAG: outer membrane beta-barrel protein [Bacteroidetes bacterium]|nr:outer membrane beta-barrel protein [Bacteroidota bacterium]